MAEAKSQDEASAAQFAADLDDLLVEAGIGPETSVEEPAPEKTLADSVDQAMAEAQGLLDEVSDDVASDAPETPPAPPATDPVSIEELDNHLADSTPVDGDTHDDAPLEEPPAQEQATHTAAELEAEALLRATEEEEMPPQAAAPTDDGPPTAPEDSASDSAESETAAVEPPPAEPSPQTEPAEPSAVDETPPGADEANPTERTEIVVGNDQNTSSQPSTVVLISRAALAVPKVLSAPLVIVPPGMRDTIGWIALVTAFNAACLWTYLVLVH